MPELEIAFLSKYKLHVRKNGVTQAIESEFERTVRDRAASIERRNAWKTQGRGAMFMGGRATQAGVRDATPVLLTGLAAGPEGSILFSMETDAVSGVFMRDVNATETRLFHTADFRIRHAALHPDGAMLAATSFYKEGFRSNTSIVSSPARNRRHGSDRGRFVGSGSAMGSWSCSPDRVSERRRGPGCCRPLRGIGPLHHSATGFGLRRSGGDRFGNRPRSAPAEADRGWDALLHPQALPISLPGQPGEFPAEFNDRCDAVSVPWLGPCSIASTSSR